MKKVLLTQRSDRPHWVGDGFPVRSIFSYNDLAQEMSPFLLMDYAGPVVFPPSDHIRGVGAHPHRGFETVTIVYSGEVDHRDSSGAGGSIKEGDVQWMTAAGGVVHEEMHGKNFAKSGGPFEMIQLWVNLPKKDKMNKPSYQGITSDQIPIIKVNGGFVRVIAGELQSKSGPAKTHTAIDLWDMRLEAGHENIFKVPANHTAAVFVLSGQIRLNGEKTLEAAEIALMDRTESTFSIYAKEDSKVLFLGGEPIHEPVVGYGPFVMNTQQEIRQAFTDYEQGKMGTIV